jgi:putative DNA primase/helicase
VNFDQEYSGYCLTGETCDKSFLIMYGEKGNNGKSVKFSLLKKILTEKWFSTLPTSAVMKAPNNADRHSGRATTDLNALKHTRLCVHAESEKDDTLNEKNLKNITGGDELTLREQYGAFEDVRTQSKIMICNNHHLTWDFTSTAMNNRARQAPYNAVFLSSDKYELADEKEKLKTIFLADQALVDRMHNEKELLSAVFTYWVDGAVKFYQHLDANEGIPVPESMTQSIAETVEEMDLLNRSMDSEVNQDDKAAFTTSADLFAHYRDWCKAQSLDSGNAITFGRDMKAKGFPSSKVNNVRGYKGFCVPDLI